ncbi:hypothetical protein D3C71_1692960 [compost metagenome]
MPELPPIPATIGIKAASATSFSMESSNRPITREAMNAVIRFSASQAQRLRSDFQTEAKMSSSSRRPAMFSTSLSLSSRIRSTISSMVRRPISLPFLSTTGVEIKS